MYVFVFVYCYIHAFQYRYTNTYLNERLPDRMVVDVEFGSYAIGNHIHTHTHTHTTNTYMFESRYCSAK